MSGAEHFNMEGIYPPIVFTLEDGTIIKQVDPFLVKDGAFGKVYHVHPSYGRYQTMCHAGKSYVVTDSTIDEAAIVYTVEETQGSPFEEESKNVFDWLNAPKTKINFETKLKPAIEALDKFLADEKIGERV